jgi:mRNA-degrading endonuclease toxin of MazEF toxin-antitoxin module
VAGDSTRCRVESPLPPALSAQGWPQRGEIWWSFTPGQPDDPHQPRPVLVISVNIRNRLSDDMIVIPIFSQGRIGPTRVALPAGIGGLEHDSVLFCEEISTIDRDFLDDGPIGPMVPEDILDLVILAVHNAIMP